MALPRHREPSAFDRVNRDGNIPTAPQATGRKAAPAEYQRRYRRGHRGGGHAPDPLWEERRNGLPVRLYRYAGTGRDAFDGTCSFEDAS